MRACVTGGAGFIGSTLVDRLLHDGHDVAVLDDFSTGLRENLADAGDRIDLVEGDLRDPALATRAVAGCEVVYHMAALAAVARSVEHPEEVTDVNVAGTVALCKRAHEAGCRRVVFASSSSVYGDTPELPKHEAMLLSPRSPYAASKAAGESYLAAFQATYGLETVALRYFNVYGPRQSPRSQYAAVIPLFIDALRAGRPATIHGDGQQTRDFTYVEDVVDALVRAADAPDATKGPMNIGGGGNRVSILDLVQAIAAALGVEPRVEHGPARVGDVRDSLADIGRATTWLGWQPTTRLHDGIARIVSSLTAAAQPEQA